jgi:hypothetical protein
MQDGCGEPPRPQLHRSLRSGLLTGCSGDYWLGGLPNGAGGSGSGGAPGYNAVLDPGSSGWLQQPFENTKVHHNLFLTYAYSGEEQGMAPGSAPIEAGLALVNFRKTGIEVYGNTFDGGGPGRSFVGPAVSVDSTCFLDSLRNNVFMRFPFEVADGSQAAVRPPYGYGISPLSELLGYADYNLFYAPDAKVLVPAGLRFFRAGPRSIWYGRWYGDEESNHYHGRKAAR